MACGFVVSDGLAPRSGLLFSHPMRLGIGYWFRGLFPAYATRHR